MQVEHSHTDTNTEEKIIAAARKVFLSKGFSGTRTRDIAEEAGINLALLNYYFRSKQKLFELVMQEKIQKLLGSLLPIFNNNATSLEDKIALIVDNYIEILSESPDLPIFVLNEIRKKNFQIVPKSDLGTVIMQSSFIKQLQERRTDINPVQFLLSILGMIIFPFVAKPLLDYNGLAKEDIFLSLMQERKKLIPVWADAILKSNDVTK
ncbi:TetR/AcrR family transcriptional regulator [Flavobacterium enshiense]|uniref:TetR family transcriptional regulator n=1 Tax=Flavobacterium enshiense DK69 TaxID=1107311 RepID=A0A0A2N5X3_9FLAO|nr:TetR family transcriptional regulator [Flavobacterium enshiense]KGO95835.1 TetR family transcriptional regulator [Flavobacterium enshiense DK69]